MAVGMPYLPLQNLADVSLSSFYHYRLSFIFCLAAAHYTPDVINIKRANKKINQFRAQTYGSRFAAILCLNLRALGESTEKLYAARYTVIKKNRKGSLKFQTAFSMIK